MLCEHEGFLHETVSYTRFTKLAELQFSVTLMVAATMFGYKTTTVLEMKLQSETANEPEKHFYGCLGMYTCTAHV